MQGLHLTADLSGCATEAAPMTDPQALRALCLNAVAAAGLGAVAEVFHRFEPAPGGQAGGVTGVVLLAESHLAVHTWPELAAVTLDVYVCNFGGDNSAKAHALMGLLLEPFAPQQVQQQALDRGSSPAYLGLAASGVAG